MGSRVVERAALAAPQQVTDAAPHSRGDDAVRFAEHDVAQIIARAVDVEAIHCRARRYARADVGTPLERLSATRVRAFGAEAAPRAGHAARRIAGIAWIVATGVLRGYRTRHLSPASRAVPTHCMHLAGLGCARWPNERAVLLVRAGRHARREADSDLGASRARSTRAAAAERATRGTCGRATAAAAVRASAGGGSSACCASAGRARSGHARSGRARPGPSRCAAARVAAAAHSGRASSHAKQHRGISKPQAESC